MATSNETLKFHGEAAKRVIIISQEKSLCNLSYADREFIRTSFNRLRNYREFKTNRTVEIVEKTSADAPLIARLKDGDAILISGCGRVIDKATYDFAITCIENDIPVYFIRSNSLDTDNRVNHSIWRYCSLTVKIANEKRDFGAPPKYFMEIPRKEDFIISGFSNEFYALLPGMVPM